MNPELTHESIVRTGSKFEKEKLAEAAQAPAR
jgi:hypothetical protein